MAKPLALCISAYVLKNLTGYKSQLYDAKMNINTAQFAKRDWSIVSSEQQGGLYTSGGAAQLCNTMRRIVVQQAHCDSIQKASKVIIEDDNQKKLEKDNSENGNVMESETMKQLLKDIKIYMKNDNYCSELEAKFNEAIQFAMKGKSLETVIFLQQMWADFCLLANRLDKAEVLFTSIMRNLLNSGKDRDDPAMIETSLKLATLYAHLGKNDNAITGYTWAVSAARQKLLTYDKSTQAYMDMRGLLGMVLDSYARYLYYVDKTKEAVKVTQEALEICNEVMGVNSSQAMILHNSLATIYATTGQMDKALESVKQSQKISENRWVTNEERAIICHNYGYILFKMNRLSEARVKLNQSMNYTRDSNLKSEVMKLISQMNSNNKKMFS